MGIKCEIRDLGWNGICRRMRELDGQSVSVGILKNAGKHNGVDLVDIAAWNEYGTSRIPPRPFMRLSTEKNAKKWANIAKTQVGRVIDGAPVSQAMDFIGSVAKGDIQEVIGDRSLLAANAPSTVRRKKSDAPLIDTGRLRQSVDYRVD